MVGLELVVGYLIAWATRKARRVGSRLDGEVDYALDAGLDRLHDAVAGQLGADPALTDLDQEASTAGGVVGDLTRRRVDLAIEAAATRDPSFGEELRLILDGLAALDGGRAAAEVSASGTGAVAVGGNVDIRADRGGAAALSIGTANIGAPPQTQPGPVPPDPSPPGRPRG